MDVYLSHVGREDVESVKWSESRHYRLQISNTAGQICVSGGACGGNFKDGIKVTTEA